MHYTCGVMGGIHAFYGYPFGYAWISLHGLAMGSRSRGASLPLRLATRSELQRRKIRASKLRVYAKKLLEDSALTWAASFRRKYRIQSKEGPEMKHYLLRDYLES